MAIADILKKLLLGRAFVAEDGRMTLLGRYDVCLYESAAFAYLVQMYCRWVGHKKALKIFKESGKIAIKKAQEAFGIKLSISLLKNFHKFMEFYGWGKFEVISFKYGDKEFDVKCKLSNSPIVENGKKLFGKNSNVCLLFIGNLSGVFSSLLGKDVEFVETACYAKGAPYCVFESRVKK
jgi:predicted hydrocarbon binding protein